MTDRTRSPQGAGASSGSGVRCARPGDRKRSGDGGSGAFESRMPCEPTGQFRNRRTSRERATAFRDATTCHASARRSSLAVPMGIRVETDWAALGGERVSSPVPPEGLARGAVRAEPDQPSRQCRCEQTDSGSRVGVASEGHFTRNASVAVKARLTSTGLEGAHAEAVAPALSRPCAETLRRKREPVGQ